MRFVDDRLIEKISRIVRLPVEAVPFEAADLPDHFRIAGECLRGGAKMVFLPKDRNHILDYATAPDIFGNPSLIFSVEKERFIYGQMICFVVLFLVTLIFFGIFAFLLTLFFLEKTALSKITLLARQISKIGENGMCSADLIPISENDGFADLAREINGIVDSIRKFQLAAGEGFSVDGVPLDPFRGITRKRDIGRMDRSSLNIGFHKKTYAGWLSGIWNMFSYIRFLIGKR